MKQTAAGILLLCFLVLPVVGTFTFLHHQKKQVRKEVKRQIIRGMDRNELVLLVFTEAESQTRLRWEHSKEFEFGGEMYDVVETETRGDSIYYWCWWDHEETALNKQLDELVENVLGKDPRQKENKDRLVKYYHSLYFAQYPDRQTYLTKTDLTPFPYLIDYRTIFDSPPVPPPRFM